MAAYRKSNKKNTRRKQTQFKKGHEFTSTLKESYTDNSSSSSVSVLKRPSSQEYVDALSAQSNCDVNVLPTKLRPVKIEVENENDFEMSEESEENIIINLNKLSDLISAFLPHKCLSASPSVKMVRRLGLCITVEVFCRNCNFISDEVDLFTTVPSSRGPDAGSLNVCLLIPVLKSKVGISDVVQVLSCLNIKSPDRRGLQRRFNRYSDMMVDVNKQQMIDNQTYVKHSSIGRGGKSS